MRSVNEMLGVCAPAQLTYSDQYRDPRWTRRASQKVREHPFCHSCKQRHSQLQVHHVVYNRNTPLWDYPDVDLVVLCRECHARFHATIDAFKRQILNLNAGEALTATGAFIASVRLRGATATFDKLSQ